MIEQIRRAFASELVTPYLTPEFIEQHPNLMEIRGAAPDVMSTVPAYMLWCAAHPGDTSLITDWTVNALAEFGRSKDPQSAWLNFRFRCTQEQRQVVVCFLEWSLNETPFLNEKQIERARRNWQHAS
ncbi:hypothetical protein GCM10027046_13130 [Uliginosibacterium flavum]|uniref:Uncharacterized protein n=1 Tax=Uliginosibacterium flavum TaxID=1396831 RepID=A0ABV2TMH9_9RHOO